MRRSIPRDKVLDLWSKGHTVKQICRIVRDEKGNPFRPQSMEKILNEAREEGDPRARRIRAVPKQTDRIEYIWVYDTEVMGTYESETALEAKTHFTEGWPDRPGRMFVRVREGL